jgi:hypothetical protein
MRKSASPLFVDWLTAVGIYIADNPNRYTDAGFSFSSAGNTDWRGSKSDMSDKFVCIFIERY